jgi:hypothetical protein
MQPQGINRCRHIEVIDEAIAELLTLHARTAEPAPLPHQYVGTIVDNTIGLLTAPANSLDRGARHIGFEQNENWLSLMQAVHRSFFSSLHTATEKALADICTKRGVQVTSRLQTASEKALTELIPELPQTPNAHRVLKNLRKLFRTVHPGFDDYLNSALGTSAIPPSAQVTWRKFFRGLSIVRNKVSHSDPTLSLAEISDLRAGGFSFMVKEPDTLVMNPRMYFQSATFTLDFLDVVCIAAE